MALLLALVLLVGGCVRVPFEEPQLTATHPLTTAELLESYWLGAATVYRIRNSGLFQLRGMKLPIEGFMELDARRRSARLVALEGMGLKLFDLKVSADAVEVNHLLPDLRKYPGLAEAVAESVRRIFFQPQPALGDRLKRGGREYRLQRDGDDRVSFTFGGDPPLLLKKTGVGPAGDWWVGYYQYREQCGRQIPEGVFLQDRRAGYTLTLWLESVKCIEQ